MIIESKNFNLKQIADSGQCFRMDRIGEDRYSLIAFGNYVELAQISPSQVEIGCSREEYERIWRGYFDLDYDYGAIVDRLLKGDDGFLKEAAAFGSGMRIVKQEPFEALISFILSQNKNIPGIKSCVKKLSERFGEPMVSREYGDIAYHGFPKPEDLAKAGKEELRSAGLGYRDDYVKAAAAAVSEGSIDLSALRAGGFETARNELRRIHGVGDKVACCVSLYGLHHLDAVPADVWIKRIEREVYKSRFNWQEYKGYAGIVQQYMFYYIRNKEA